MNTKKIGFLIAGILAIFAGYFIYQKTASPTKIALYNYLEFEASNIALSNDNSSIRYELVPAEDIDKLKNFDFILGAGMGLKISDKQREQIKEISKKVPTLFTMITNPDNRISSLNKEQDSIINSYLDGSDKSNFKNLSLYIRKEIDKKTFFVSTPQKATPPIEDVYFHLKEGKTFEKLSDFEAYLKKEGLYKENAPKIALLTGIHNPFGGNKFHIDSTIVSLQKKGFNVYPIFSFMERLKFLREIKPDAVVYFPHGRVKMGHGGDKVVQFLKEQNIPIFAPVSVIELKEKWEQNPMGLQGGYLGQSVVMPELDGAIYPYVTIAQFKEPNGMFSFRTIPDRLEKFTTIVKNYISLKNKNIADTKVAIYFLKGTGSHSLQGQGLEASESLYNVLNKMKQQGYNLTGLPASYPEFEALLHKSGRVFTRTAKGDFEKFLSEGNPQLVDIDTYNSWINTALTPTSVKELKSQYGNDFGDYMTTVKDNKKYIAVSQIQFGNVVILPQPVVALDKDDFTAIHGVNQPPTPPYIASYLWVRNSFHPDAIMHFGTHGSLEFTPGKQVALSSSSWGDALIGTTPHFYYYSVGNIGESIIAKRRSYANIISYLTPPFMESQMRNTFKKLMDGIRVYHKSPDSEKQKLSLIIKKTTVEMGIHRELRLDSILSKPYSDAEISKIENFAEEISVEKINAKFYQSTIPYSPDKIKSTVLAISTDPIAYSLASLHKIDGKITQQDIKNRVFFTEKYLNPAKKLVENILSGKSNTSQLIHSFAGITPEQVNEANLLLAPKRMGHRPSSAPVKTVSKQEREKALAIVNIDRAISNVLLCVDMLKKSPDLEIQTILRALKGGYIEPSVGGDPVANPRSLPTGRNMYSINAETTPTEIAWDRGVKLAQETIDQYKEKHGQYPKKVCYTFWSSEFIETEGVSIAQAMYMLGVEPIRDSFGRISELRLIPEKELGRPRIDIIIQTSGQFRDLAASRLFLLTKAVELAANAPKENFENMVALGNNETEKLLVEKGVSPKDARELAKHRIFGGIQGRYDTGVKELITSSDKWDSQNQIAEAFISNMGAVYGMEKSWGVSEKEVLRATLKNTDILMQPRQNNTWGALSLDHVFEFMGGMNTAIKAVTGKDPDAFLSDYRNHNNMRIQELKEAIGVESRSTIFNPAYIKEMTSGAASEANHITDIITNTFGWSATRPEVIDNQMWDNIYDTYVLDKLNLGVNKFLEEKSPADMQEITAILLESARKGFWKASKSQIETLVSRHTALVQKHGLEPGGFAGENQKLQSYIKSLSSSDVAQNYQNKIDQVKNTRSQQINSNGKEQVLEKQTVTQSPQSTKTNISAWIIALVVIISISVLGLYINKRRKE